MNKVKRLLCIAMLLCLVGSAPAFATSTQYEPGFYPVEDKTPVTLSIFHSMQIILPSGILDNPVMQQMQKDTGITLDWSPYMGGTDASQRLSVLIASGDLPDIIINTDAQINQKLIENDLILPLDELAAKRAPNLELFDDALAFNRMFWSNDTGKLYMIPMNINNVSFYATGYDTVFQIRWDLYEKMGKPPLNNLDDLYSYAIKALELEPQTADGQKTYSVGMPLADAGGWAYVDWDQMHYDGFVDKGSFAYMDIEKNVLTPRIQDENSSFWRSMAFYNKLYRAGALDPESATMKFQQCQDKGKALRYHIGLANWQIGWPNGIIFANKDKERGYCPILLDSKPDYTFYEFFFDTGNGAQLSISKTCKNPERAMDLINYLASYGGPQLFNNGPEGVDWDYVDGIPQNHPVDPNAQSDPDALKKLGVSYVSPNFIINGDLTDPRGWRTRYADNNPKAYWDYLTEPEKQFCEENGYAYPTQIYYTREHHVASTSLLGTVVPDPNSDVAILEGKLNTYAEPMIIKTLYAASEEEFQTLKAEMIGQLKQRGVDTVFQWYYDNYELAKTKLNSLK